MKRITFALITMLVMGCGNSTTPTQNSASSVQRTEETVDYSKLIKLISVETGLSPIGVYGGIPEFRLSVKNISGKPIKERVAVKFRLTKNGKVFRDGIIVLQNQRDIPWNAGLVKLESESIPPILDMMKLDMMKKGINIRVEIYDDNNNLLWEGDIEKKILNKL